MKLLSLTLDNFRCFENCTLDLNVDGLIGVIGPNGAGKSTLFGAVDWAFYGNQRGPGALTPIRDGAAGCRVEVDFSLGEHRYRLWRTNRTAELRLIDTGVVLANGTTATSAEVAATLGMPRATFLSTFYARQREIQALDVRGDTAHRRAHLERLLGIERLRRATDLARAQAKEQRVLVRAIEEQKPDLDETLGELRRREDEARLKAPAVEAARENILKEKARRKKARATLADVRKRAETGREQKGKATLAVASADQAQREVGRIQAEVEAANEASKALQTLTPIAARRAELGARERELELRRKTYERARSLREQWHAAQARVAKVADELASVSDAGSAVATLGEHVTELRTKLDVTTSELLEVIDELAEVEKQKRDLVALLQITRRAHELDRALIELPEVARIAERTAAALVDLQAAKTDLNRKIAEESSHLAAVQRDGTDAECPRCKRAYGDDYETIVGRLTVDLDRLEIQAKRVETELKVAERLRRDASARLATLRALESERALLQPAKDVDKLEQEAHRLSALREKRADRRLLVEAKRGELQAQLDQDSGRLRKLKEQDMKRGLTRERLAQAQSEARILDEQLTAVGPTDYNAAVHTQIRNDLAEAEEAERQCAVLHALADQLPIVERRYSHAAAQLACEEAEAARLSADAAKLAVTDEVIGTVEEEDRAAEVALQAAFDALHAAEQGALREDAAVSAARENLARAQEQARRLKTERRELRYRDAVHAALEDYRADASRRALPTLEQETASLLAAVTRGRFTDVHLSDSYNLELQDGPNIFGLGRFSGGEQDIANLCLRLALSRALARQRGIETGFVILDEILGSQDIDRRAAIMGQLRELLRDFRQILLVSHFEDIADQCDLHIRVSQRNGAAAAQIHL